MMAVTADTAPTQLEKGRNFRALHEGPGAFVIPNPWDAGTARILTRLGFPALTTTSAGLAFALGRRDGVGAVSRDEALENAKAIVEATRLPVAADLENGYGDAPEVVAETIRLASARSGLVGGSIEDATGDVARPIYDVQHATDRIVAAAEAARNLPCPFILVARAENYLHGRGNLDDTIRRLQAYAAAGADVVYAPGLTREPDIRAVCQSVTKPVNVVMGLVTGGFSVSELAAMGVKRISVGSAFARAALTGFLQAASEVVDRGTFQFANAALSYSLINRFMDERV